MSSNKQLKIVVAGISGMFGHQIAEELVSKKKNAQIIGILRSRSNQTEQIQNCLSRLEKQGVQIVECDACKPESYSKYLKDVDVIVSALKGGRECVVDAQKTLYDVGVKQGNLKLFIPSDFSIDFFNIPKEENPWLGWRREFAEWLDQKKDNVKVVHILNGCFMDAFFSNLGMVDLNATPKKLNYYGNEIKKLDLITTRDAAKFTSEVVFDNDPPSKLLVAGDVVTLKQIVDTFNKYNGENAMKLNKLGDIKDLESKLNEIKDKFKSDQSKWTPFALQLTMLKDNRGKLSTIMNDKYPNVKTTSLSNFLETEKFSTG